MGAATKRKRTAGTAARRPSPDRVLEVFYEIGRALARGAGYEEVSRALVKAGTELTGGDAAGVLVVDPATRLLVHRVAHGLTGAERSISFAPGEGIAGWVAARGRAAVVADVEKDKRFAEKGGQRRDIRSLLCVPVKLRAKVVGVLTVTSARRNSFRPSHARLLALLASQVAVDLEHARLDSLAHRDALTGVANRRRFDEALAERLEEARLERRPLAVALFDLDRFKRVNDRYGHPAGDDILRAAAQRWAGALRDEDLLARIGGEEFALILPKATLARATEIAERLRERTGARPFNTRKGEIPVTVSVGVAASRSGATTAEKLLADADQALYAAKAAGRDRVKVAGR